MDTNDVIMLVLAEHIVEKLTSTCRTLVLLKRSFARIHIANTDVPVCESVVAYESTIRWDQILDDVLASKKKLMCELTHCTVDNLRNKMTDILETQYRELVAAIMVVMMQKEITDYHIKMETGNITIDFKLLPVAYNPPTMKQIVEQVARYYGIEMAVIWGGNREATMPRKVAIYLVRKLTNHSLEDIAKEFRRDRSMILYAIRRIDHEIKSGNEGLKSAIADIAKQFNELK